jgi:ABC-type transport system involved in multi-copper enzyme maturation permease subunit
MTAVEQSKIFKRTILWAELGLLALAVIVMNVVIYAALQMVGADDLPGRENNIRVDGSAALDQFLTWPGALLNALRLASGNNVGGMLVIILAGAITGQEYTWRTLSLWLSRGISRPVVLGAKFVALLTPLLLITLTPLLVGGAMTAVFSQQLTGAVAYDQVNWGQLGLGVLRTAFTLLPYASLAILLAVASRSTIVVIGAGLAYSLVIEGIAIQLLSLMGGTWAKVGQYLPAGLTNSLMGTNAGMVTVTVDDVGAVANHLDPGTAALGIALYTLAFMGLSLLIFRRQDLGG